jgi:hypothetical protein
MDERGLKKKALKNEKREPRFRAAPFFPNVCYQFYSVAKISSLFSPPLQSILSTALTAKLTADTVENHRIR